MPSDRTLLTWVNLESLDTHYLLDVRPWALVTGGVGALGAAIVARLDEVNTPTVVLDPQLPAKPSTRVSYYQVDVSDYRAIQAISRDLLQALGPPRYLIATAGLYERRSLFEYDPEALERILRANLVSLVYTLRFFLQPMMSASSGRVIALSSQVGVSGGIDPLYAATKAGVTAIMKSTAKEYARSGVTFSTVSLGDR